MVGVRRGHARALGLAFGAVLDQVVPDPRRGHPVALYGSAVGALERRIYADSRAAGIRFGVLAVGAAALLGVAARHRFPVLVVGTWAVLGGRSLATEAAAVDDHLASDDLDSARGRLTHLVGRRTEALDESEICRAVIESVAENTCDAVVAPLIWGAVAGLPGLLAYRAVNTLDAMVGHHNVRYEHFGWAPARTDDLANWLPARLTALLTATVAPVVGADGGAAFAAARADARRHPSPNSGWSEAAFAGALGIRLGGRNDYGSHVEDRPVLHSAGRPPERADIARAVRLERAVTGGAVVVGAALALHRGFNR